MKKPNVAKYFKYAKFQATKHSPGILTGIGIVGFGTTVVLAVKATPKALQLIEETKKEEQKEELTATETVKATWKCYIPAAVTGIVSTACLIGANSVSTRRTAALAAAYQISETALSEYREKVIETIGEKKEQIVRDKVKEKQMEKNPVSKSQVIVAKGGDTLCYESISGRYFKSDIEKIKQAENILNKRMLTQDYVSLSEFYDEIGLEATSISDDLGWSVDKDLIELDFSSMLADDGRPCIVIDYRVPPQYNYSKFA